nr:MAG TPA: hypothetical protein [Caudoviricetes sp.]
MRLFLFKGIQYLIISNSASYASLKQKRLILLINLIHYILHVLW